MRLGVNLLGGRAMSPREFATYKPKTLLGASLTVRAPTGQYDPTRLINIGTNRWAFRPEVGVVQVMGKWAVDAYVGAWLFTDNSDFYGGTTRKQDPVYSSEVHLRYLFRRGLWAAMDANFWYGGKATVDGRGGDDLQRNSRVGLTVSWQRPQGPQSAVRRQSRRLDPDRRRLRLLRSVLWLHLDEEAVIPPSAWLRVESSQST